MDVISGRRSRVRVSGHDDRISNLSDDLLHVILLKLLSTTAAARTSVLSRRWRHVWASLPDLLLENINAADSVDAALAACSAPTATRLAINMPLLFPNDLTTARVNPWLRFAAERRLAGELTLRLPRTVDAEGEITLPLLEKVTRITLTISSSTLRVLPTGGGTFASLTVARITGARMASRDIKRFGSARCPCLRTLELRGVSLVTGSEVSIRSESLERLVLHVRIAGGRLELVTPRLQYLRAPARCSMLLQATVVAPKLADLGWHVDYRREQHRFVEAGTHLRRLVITGKGGSMVPLLRRFHTVDELVLKSGDRQGGGSHRCLVVPMPILAECETLEVDLQGTFIVGETEDKQKHAFAPSVLHLLRKLQGLRKLVLHLPLMNKGYERGACTRHCPAEGCKIDDIVLDILEEVVLLDFNGADEHLNFLSLLLACNAANLDTISINMFSDNPSATMQASQQRIIDMASPKIDVRFNLWSHGTWVPYVCTN